MFFFWCNKLTYRGDVIESLALCIVPIGSIFIVELSTLNSFISFIALKLKFQLGETKVSPP